MRTFAKFVALLALVFVTACGGGSGGDGGDTVTVQLDWTPNTNHTGIYVALAKGWYKDAGIKVNILPYTDVNPDVVVANGKADIGISFPPNVVFSRAQGLDVVSVASVLQKGVTELAVLDSSDIKRPKDLDGRLYAGFGLPYEEPLIKTVITSDGGKGTFRTATLSTAAYEALYAKRADFTEIFTTWEGIEADIRGIKLRTFRPDQFGVPDHPAVVLIAKGDAADQAQGGTDEVPRCHAARLRVRAEAAGRSRQGLRWVPAEGDVPGAGHGAPLAGHDGAAAAG